MVDPLAASGAPWNGACSFRATAAPLVDDATVGQRLLSLARHLEADRSILKHGEFFNPQGLRMKIEEVSTH
jgi:hypothetical protein